MFNIKDVRSTALEHIESYLEASRSSILYNSNKDYFLDKIHLDPSLGYTIGMGRANGTFGELLQGILPNRENFMITFPVNMYSYATFIPDTINSDIEVFPVHKTKSRFLVQNILKFFNIRAGGTLIIESDLPEGKGLASSSADLVATTYAVSNSIGINISKTLISDFIRHIEPSDGVMYQGIVSFNYKKMRLIEHLGHLPSLTIIAVDEGGEIDTLKYNSKERSYNNIEATEYQNLLDIATLAIKQQDLHTVGKISTQSAIMNQKNNNKRFLKQILQIAKTVNGLGICVAHSGTFIGILLDRRVPNFIFQINECIKEIKKFSKNIHLFNSIDFQTGHLKLLTNK